MQGGKFQILPQQIFIKLASRGRRDNSFIRFEFVDRRMLCKHCIWIKRIGNNRDESIEAKGLVTLLGLVITLKREIRWIILNRSSPSEFTIMSEASTPGSNNYSRISLNPS